MARATLSEGRRRGKSVAKDGGPPARKDDEYSDHRGIVVIEVEAGALLSATLPAQHLRMKPRDV